MLVSEALTYPFTVEASSLCAFHLLPQYLETLPSYPATNSRMGLSDYLRRLQCPTFSPFSLGNSSAANPTTTRTGGSFSSAACPVFAPSRISLPYRSYDLPSSQLSITREVPFPRPPATYLPPPALIYQSAIPPRVEFHPGNPIAPSFECPEPDRGTIPSMRDRSRLDNLPQHNSLRPGPSIRAPAVPVASGSSTTPNPFAVTTSVRPANANPGASSKEKKKRKKALKATKVVADTSEPVVSERKFFVLCMPFTHDDNEDLLLLSPPYEFRHEHIAALVETLELYNLTFELSLTVGAKNLWSTLDAAVRLHARKHKIIIPSTPADGSLHPYYTAADFSNAPWVPLQAKTSRKLKVLEPVEWVAYSYTEPALHKLAKSILNPKEEGVPLIFIAPTYGNLRGPLTVIDTGLVDDTPDAHRCFPYRVWYSLPWQDDVDAAVCFTPPGPAGVAYLMLIFGRQPPTC
ncbi:hypothetical protein C8R45DRAFT_1115263 [Mycena sanguinolenta]|nr:hypothetical protein C8R45DRAFT_1115263 [Mycena sanguinolenta]